ncbi:MAG: hypothetical protein CME70_08975 [Halobacteriovorax sp.]|nr:hypothetical protein [Halobacteriovorax sp.]|tara:strand:- start:47985 stop:48992 length:1008 start_codon:yes stop_codon:yes gene_type:complete
MKLLLNIYLRAFWSLVKKPPAPRVLINYFKYYLCRLRPKLKLDFTPTNLVIYTTKSCNLNCDFCFIGDDLNPENPKKYELTFEDYSKIKENKFFKNSLRLGLLGGEPFIAKDIFLILEDLKKYGKITTVVTNAMLLKGEKLERFKECPPTILGLSLYPENEEDVERVFKELDSKTIVWIQTIIEATDLKKIYRVLDYCRKIGCKNIRMGNYYPTYGNGMEHVIFEDNEEYKTIRKEVDSKFGGEFNIDWLAPVQRKVNQKVCLQPLSYIHIDNTGEIGACFMRSPNKDIYGSIFDQDAWNNKANQDLRKNMYFKKEGCDPWCRFCENLGEDLYKI